MQLNLHPPFTLGIELINNYDTNIMLGLLLELVVRFAHKYGLGEKNVRCLFRHSCVLQLLQLLLFATTIYLSKMIDPSKKHAH